MYGEEDIVDNIGSLSRLHIKGFPLIRHHVESSRQADGEGLGKSSNEIFHDRRFSLPPTSLYLKNLNLTTTAPTQITTSPTISISCLCRLKKTSFPDPISESALAKTTPEPVDPPTQVTQVAATQMTRSTKTTSLAKESSPAKETQPTEMTSTAEVTSFTKKTSPVEESPPNKVTQPAEITSPSSATCSSKATLRQVEPTVSSTMCSPNIWGLASV